MWNVLEDDQPPEDAVAFVAQVGMGSKGVTLGSNGVKLLNPGEKNDKTRHPFMFTALHRKLQNKVSSVAPCASPLGPSKDHDKSDDRSKDNATAFFVSQGSHGIVDLGASLSVIGDQQLKELCSSAIGDPSSHERVTMRCEFPFWERCHGDGQTWSVHTNWQSLDKSYCSAIQHTFPDRQQCVSWFRSMY